MKRTCCMSCLRESAAEHSSQLLMQSIGIRLGDIARSTDMVPEPKAQRHEKMLWPHALHIMKRRAAENLCPGLLKRVLAWLIIILRHSLAMLANRKPCIVDPKVEYLLWCSPHKRRAVVQYGYEDPRFPGSLLRFIVHKIACSVLWPGMPVARYALSISYAPAEGSESLPPLLHLGNPGGAHGGGVGLPRTT